jgi:hypothetical protein
MKKFYTGVIMASKEARYTVELVTAKYERGADREDVEIGYSIQKNGEGYEMFVCPPMRWNGIVKAPKYSADDLLMVFKKNLASRGFRYESDTGSFAWNNLDYGEVVAFNRAVYKAAGVPVVWGRKLSMAKMGMWKDGSAKKHNRGRKKAKND